LLLRDIVGTPEECDCLQDAEFVARAGLS